MNIISQNHIKNHYSSVESMRFYVNCWDWSINSRYFPWTLTTLSSSTATALFSSLPLKIPCLCVSGWICQRFGAHFLSVLHFLSGKMVCGPVFRAKIHVGCCLMFCQCWEASCWPSDWRLPHSIFQEKFKNGI